MNVGLFITGYFSIFPGWVNQNGYANFSSDSFSCHSQALELVELLRNSAWSLWWDMNSRFHTRLASICYWLWGHWSAYSNLSLLPLNLGTLFLTWLGWNRLISLLGGEVPRSSKILYLLPLVILHFTQLLRDPYYISVFIWWLVAWILLFQTQDNSKHVKAWLMIVCLSPFLFWVRERFWVTSQVMSLVWLLLAMTLILFRKHTFKWLLGVFFICLGMNSYSIYKYAKKNWFQQIDPLENVDPQKKDFVFFYKLASLRRDFNKSYHQPSSIDNHIEFKNDQDVIDYLPRALLIGFLAPFPDMWWEKGRKAGTMGRLMSALEMIFMWGVMGLGLLLFLFHPKKLEWLICFSAIIVLCLALGYVVSNVGALYRMRFVTWLIWLALVISSLSKSSPRAQNDGVKLETSNEK
jgi:hypothetical protein